jgi:hypothetical protein
MRNILLRSQGRSNRQLFCRLGHQKLSRELNLDVSTEELLSAEKAFTYTDLYAMFANNNAVVWLTPHSFVVHANWTGVYPWEDLNGSRHVYFNVDGKEIVALASSPEHLLEISEVVTRLLAASTVYSVTLGTRGGAFINAATLAYLL